MNDLVASAGSLRVADQFRLRFRSVSQGSTQTRNVSEACGLESKTVAPGCRRKRNFRAIVARISTIFIIALVADTRARSASGKWANFGSR